MDIRAVLISLDHVDGLGRVVMDHSGDVWLVSSAESWRDVRLDDHQPRGVGLVGSRTLLGGRLPPGAVSAEVVTGRGVCNSCTVGGGAWAVVIDEPPAPMLPQPLAVFRDALGIAVAPLLPADWSRVPLADTDETCPGCGGGSWDVVTATDNSRGSTGNLNVPGAWKPLPVVVCRGCGHEERVGAVTRIRNPPDQVWPDTENAEQLDHAETVRLRHQMVLDGVDFVIYGVQGMAGSIGESRSRNEAVTSITVDCGAAGNSRAGQVRVTTATEPTPRLSGYGAGDSHEDDRDDETRAREALLASLQDPAKPRGVKSDAAWALSRRLAERRAQVAIARAVAEMIEIPVDGRQTEFTCVRHEQDWVAVGHLDELFMTVSGSGAEPSSIRLAAVANPTETLL